MKIIFTIFLFFIYALATSQKMHFSKNIGNTFISNPTTAFLQDKQGYMWIGTDHGLFRFDGIDKREFVHLKDDSTSIPSNKITCLYQSNSGTILIGTNEGLCLFFPDTEVISRLNLRDEPLIINQIIEGQHKCFWLGTSYGLYQLDESFKIRKILESNDKKKGSLSGNAVWSVMEDSQNRIWAGTNNGFTIFKNDDTYQLNPVFGDFNKTLGFASDRVFSIVELESNCFWLATYDGIFEVSQKDTFEFKHIYKGEGVPGSFYNHIFFNMIKSPDGTIWAGSFRGGLNHFKKTKEGIQHKLYRSNSQSKNNIRINEINELYFDNSNLLWVGTKLGVDIGSNHKNKFNVLQNTTHKNSLSSNVIKSVFFDSKNNLWVGTYDGLNFCASENIITDSFLFKRINYNQNNKNGLRNDNINGINEDSFGNLWISCMFGLHFFNIQNYLEDEKINCFTHKNGLPHTINYNCVHLENNQYLVGGYNNVSILSLDKKNYINSKWDVSFKSKSHEKLKANTIFDIEIDSMKNIWLGSNNGIHKMIIAKDSIVFKDNKSWHDSLRIYDNTFNCFYRASKTILWVGTNYGLNKMILDSFGNPLQVISIKNPKLTSNPIMSIIKDNQGLLWLGTIKGLFVIDPVSFEIKQNFTLSDGLPSLIFNKRSVAKDVTGNLYFGTDNGLVIIDPENIPVNNFIPQVQFTSLTLYNDLQVPNKNNSILQKSINYTQSIELDYKQKYFSLSFASLDFTNPHINKYKYNISSLGENWINLGTQNSITITDLKPGKHTVSVKGSNSDGLWSSNATTLDIIINPPFWKTWIAYSLYLICTLLFLYFYLRIKVKRKIDHITQQSKIDKARIEEREILRQKNAEDFHDELGHRLSKISLFLELAERSTRKSSQTNKYITRIKEHTSNLSGGIRDLIWSLDPKKDSLFQTLIRLQEFGDQLYEFSQINFKSKIVNQNQSKVVLSADERKHILMIFKEAMNNSFKHSNAKNVHLGTSIKNMALLVCLVDDGIGFSKNNSFKGYGLSNMKSRAHKLGAKLIIDSDLGHGTKITLTLKIKNDINKNTSNGG